MPDDQERPRNQLSQDEETVKGFLIGSALVISAALVIVGAIDLIGDLLR